MKGFIMCEHHFWLTEAQFDRLKPLLPNKVRGVPRACDRKVISGIIHVIRYGLMWRHAPACYGPHKTLYNRFVRWSQAGVFNRIFQTLATEGAATGTLMIDSTHLKAHRSAASLLKKGTLRATSDAAEAVSTRNFTPSATARASPSSWC